MFASLIHPVGEGGVIRLQLFSWRGRLAGKTRTITGFEVRARDTRTPTMTSCRGRPRGRRRSTSTMARPRLSSSCHLPVLPCPRDREGRPRSRETLGARVRPFPRDGEARSSSGRDSSARRRGLLSRPRGMFPVGARRLRAWATRVLERMKLALGPAKHAPARRPLAPAPKRFVLARDLDRRHGDASRPRNGERRSRDQALRPRLQAAPLAPPSASPHPPRAS